MDIIKQMEDSGLSFDEFKWLNEFLNEQSIVHDKIVEEGMAHKKIVESQISDGDTQLYVINDQPPVSPQEYLSEIEIKLNEFRTKIDMINSINLKIAQFIDKIGGVELEKEQL